jgi:hypothetical protein
LDFFYSLNSLALQAAVAPLFWCGPEARALSAWN